MKKYWLILAAMLLFSMTAQAQTYWNSVDNEYSHCGGCRTCSEFLFRYSYTGEVGSRPDCTSCDDGYYLQPIHADNADGVFTTYNVCWPDCPSNCSSCSDSSTCTSCDYGYTLSNGACVKKPTCTSGQYTASDGTCQPCSNISVPNGSCLSCSSSSQCDNISCNTGYVKKGSTCVKAATCTYPLKEVADYSGECVGCCTD